MPDILWKQRAENDLLQISGSKLSIDATMKIPDEGFKRSWPPLIKMDEAVRKKIDTLFAQQKCGAHPHRSARAGMLDS